MDSGILSIEWVDKQYTQFSDNVFRTDMQLCIRVQGEILLKIWNFMLPHHLHEVLGLIDVLSESK